jgi:hypothetical protein
VLLEGKRRSLSFVPIIDWTYRHFRQQGAIGRAPLVWQRSSLRSGRLKRSLESCCCWQTRIVCEIVRVNCRGLSNSRKFSNLQGGAFCISSVSKRFGAPGLYDHSSLQRAAVREPRRMRCTRHRPCAPSNPLVLVAGQCMDSDDRQYGRILWIATRDQCEVFSVSNEMALITRRSYSTTIYVGSALARKPEVFGIGYEQHCCETYRTDAMIFAYYFETLSLLRPFSFYQSRTD